MHLKHFIKRGSIAHSLFLFLLVAWPYYLNDFYLIPLSGPHSPLGVLWALDLVFFFLIPVITLYLLYRQGHLAHIKILLNKKPSARALILAVILAVLVNILVDNYLQPWLYQNGCCRLCYGYPFPSAPVLKALTIAYAALSAGFLEEIIFRGHVIGLVKRHWNSNLAAILVSCALFALIHWCQGSGKLASTFLIAFIPAIWVIRSRNLWPPILFHVVVNLLSWI